MVIQASVFNVFLLQLLICSLLRLWPKHAKTLGLMILIRLEVSSRNQVLLVQQPSHETGCNVFWNCIGSRKITLSISASV